MPAKKKESTSNVNDLLDEKIASAGLSSTLRMMDEYEDMNVECISTGFPSLDNILHPTLMGLPRSRHSVFFSRKPSAGKTTAAMQVVKAWQNAGMRTAIIDVENTITEPFIHSFGIVTDRDQDPNKYATRLMRSTIDMDSEKAILLNCEQILDMVRNASMFLDLIVIDSIDAMVAKSEQEKDAEDNKRVGGISKLLSEHFRNNTTKRAAILWVNQMRQKTSFSPMGETWVMPGGNAVPFYSTIQVEFTMIKKLTENENSDPYGFISQLYTVKNKISPQWRRCNLTHIFGEGFSSSYDYFDLALKSKIIEKSGTWFSFEGHKAQGKIAFYRLMKQEPELLRNIMQLVDGESVPADPPEEAK